MLAIYSMCILQVSKCELHLVCARHYTAPTTNGVMYVFTKCSVTFSKYIANGLFEEEKALGTMKYTELEGIPKLKIVHASTHTHKIHAANSATVSCSSGCRRWRVFCSVNIQVMQIRDCERVEAQREGERGVSGKLGGGEGHGPEVLSVERYSGFE